MGVVAVFLFKGFATVIFFEGLATLIFGVILGKSSWKSTRYFSINRLKLIRDHSVLIRSILGILLIVDNAQQITWINAQKTPLFSSNHRFQMKVNTKIHGNFEWSVSRFEEFRRASGRRKNSLDLFGLALFWFSFIASTKFRWLFCCDVRRIVPKNWKQRSKYNLNFCWGP